LKPKSHLSSPYRDCSLHRWDDRAGDERIWGASHEGFDVVVHHDICDEQLQFCGREEASRTGVTAVAERSIKKLALESSNDSQGPIQESI